MQYPIRNLSSWQRREWMEIVDYGRSCLEMPMKQENWELASIDYPRIFFYILNCNSQTTMAFIGIYKCTYMVMKIIGIPTVFDASQLLADYHCHFHAYPMILTVYAIDYFWIFKTNAHARALETIYSIIFQLNEIF